MPRPCPCDKYQPGGPFRPGTDCIYCHLWHNYPDLPQVRLWKGLAVVTVLDRPELDPRRPDKPCDFELEVLEEAMCGCESKHVRACGGGLGKCTRGYVRGSPYQPCYRCERRTVGGATVGPIRADLSAVAYPPADD